MRLFLSMRLDGTLFNQERGAVIGTVRSISLSEILRKW